MALQGCTSYQLARNSFYKMRVIHIVAKSHLNPNIPYHWKRTAPAEATLGRRTLLSPADMTRLSEYIMLVTDVLCLRAMTIKGARKMPAKCVNFQLQHVSLCMQGTAEVLKNLGTLNSCVATGCPVPEFSGTVGEMVDVLVESVFLSESGGRNSSSSLRRCSTA